VQRRLVRPGERWPGRGLPGRNGSGGNGRGGRGRRKGDWWRHWTWKKAVSVLAAACALVMMLGAAAVAMVYSKTPIPQPQQAVFQAASSVYFSNGKTLIGQFGLYDRQLLTYNQIPKVLRDAVVAAEDKNFWHEGGVSPTGIMRAAYYDLTSSGGNLQGGSTITQQLVRNFYDDVGTAQTLSRKIKEIFIAQKVAQVKSKDWILQEYLNTVYFGQGAYGVGAAAQVYFGLGPSQLNQITPAQAAMIAAMIQQPGNYSPNPKDGARYQGLVFRWKYVLGAMVKMGTLSAQDAAKAKFPTVVKPINNSWSGYNGYVMNAVLYELENTYHYSQHEIFNGGLRITTTFNQRLMNSLYATVRANRTLMRHASPPSPPGGPTVPCGPRGCLPKYVHIGALLEDPLNGAILAMYSGQNYKARQYDDALQSRNQVGSSFKPYVLATAVSQGMNVMTSKLNGFAPLWIPPDSQPMTFASLHNNNQAASWYQVNNDEVSNPNRPVSVVEATAMSLNTAYADLWHRVALNPTTGDHHVVDMAKSFGVDTLASHLTGPNGMQDEAGTALGQASLTVEEQANTIATLADGGVYHAPHVIKEIQNGTQAIMARVPSHIVLTPDQAAEVDYAMSFDMGSMGTANGLGLTNGQTVIAKTGTTNLAQSAFFMGATPRYAMAVGMFVDSPVCKYGPAICQSASALSYTPPAGLQTLYGVGGEAGYGGQWPAIIWHDYFMRNFDSQSLQAWPPLPANFGSAWNLVGPNLMPKPKPHPNPFGGGGLPCQGNGRRCHPTPPIPTPPLPTPPFPTATPTMTAAPVRAAAAGGLVVGSLAVGWLAAGGLSAGWLPGRGRRRRTGRQAGNGDS
jgi:membrane peptidoglycan carboxypeptidase